MQPCEGHLSGHDNDGAISRTIRGEEGRLLLVRELVSPHDALSMVKAYDDAALGSTVDDAELTSLQLAAVAIRGKGRGCGSAACYAENHLFGGFTIFIFTNE